MAVEYRELLQAIEDRTGVDTDTARVVAEATLTAIARRLGHGDRSRLLRALPTELRDDFPVFDEPRRWDEAGLVKEISALSRQPAERTWLNAQAVLATVAEQEPDLVAGLTIPAQARELFRRPQPGGRLTGPSGHQAPLTEGEVAEALRRLPYWSGDTRRLVRVIELPEENLAAVLDYIEQMRHRVGRGPEVHRLDGAAELVVRTRSVDAVTALDVDLAHRIDAAIDAAGAGIETH
jgi:pterin-4a-carbinolamine dehydratase/uncharacterized protein (DUF2267 family)